MTTILSIDPGPTESAWVSYDGAKPTAWAKVPNEQLLGMLRAGTPCDILVIEQIAAMGMAVGASVFETCVWTGRYIEAWDPMPWYRVKRHQVKMHLCGHPRAKDPNIRQALIDRYGGKDAAIGKKKTPGPLYGMAGDGWAALAVAVTWADKH